jgi:hypothetical protein
VFVLSELLPTKLVEQCCAGRNAAGKMKFILWKRQNVELGMTTGTGIFVNLMVFTLFKLI